MVKGLDTFKRHFADFSNCYILIGGSACDVFFIARISSCSHETSVPESPVGRG